MGEVDVQEEGEIGRPDQIHDRHLEEDRKR